MISAFRGVDRYMGRYIRSRTIDMTRWPSLSRFIEEISSECWNIVVCTHIRVRGPCNQLPEPELRWQLVWD